jgi:hypothetical protein
LQADPLCSGLTVKGSALRSCQASFFDETMFSAMLTMWNGRQPSPRPVSAGQSCHIATLSFSSNPVNGFAVFSRS